MKRLHLIFFLLVITSSFAQVVSNGDFESWTGTTPDDWTTIDSGITTSQESAIIHSGSSSASIEVTTGTQANTDIRQSISLVNGDDYTVSVWVKHTEGQMKARLYVDGYRDYSDNGNLDWQEITYSFTASSTSIEIGLRFYDQSGFDGSEIVYVDDFVITNTSVSGPEIDVKGNSISITNGDHTPSSSDFTDFENAEVGGTSVTRTFIIKNLGTSDLDLTGTAPTYIDITGDNAGDFSISSNPTTPVSSGSETSFEVTFTPTVLGLRTADLTFNNSDADEDPYTFSIQGTGTNSVLSDIVAVSFSYHSNIDYLAYQADPISNTSHSVQVFKFEIRDGGGNDDLDTLETEMTAISFSVDPSHIAFIRTAALFDGNLRLNNTPTIDYVSGEITFSGLSGTDYSAPDGGSKQLSLRVTFNTTVTDNEQLQFSISSATANTDYSVFASSDAGGAASSIASDVNRIEVTASQLRFDSQPSNTNVDSTMTTVTVQGVDVNENLDLDFEDPISLSSSGTMTSDPITENASSGVASFTNIVHTVSGINYTLSASHASFDSITSLTFDITEVSYENGDYRTIGSGNWLSNDETPAIWERLVSGSWVSHNSPSYSTSNTIFIREGHTITTGGSFGSSVNISIMDGGILRINHNGTANSIKVYQGGLLRINQTLTITEDFEVEDDATVEVNHEYSNPLNSIWKGSEVFHPNSNFIFIDYKCSSENLIEDDTAVSVNTYNGYTAAFGNVIIDFQDHLTASDDWDLLNNGVTINLAHGNLVFRSQETNGADMRISSSGTVSSGIGGDFIVEDAYTGTQNINFKTSGTLDFVINGDMELNAATLRVTAGSNPTSTVTVMGDLRITPSAVLNFGSTSSSNATAVLNLHGDISVATSGLLMNGNTSKNAELNFTGTGDGLSSETTQTINIASTSSSENKYIDFIVKPGAYVKQIERDFELGKNASLQIKSGATYDFGYNGTTALNLMISGTQTGTVFNSESGSILKITNPNGITTAADVGNVQTVPSGRSYSQTGVFHYIGKESQETGNALTSGSTAKTIICDLETNSLYLSTTNSTGTTNKLDIRKGVVVNTDTNYIYGSGELHISDGGLQTSVLDATLPLLSGSYYLSGGFVELNANADQTLRGSRSYRNLFFSESGYKTTSSSISTINGLITTRGSAILSVGNHTMGGVNTDLTMLDTSQYITAGVGVKPDAYGVYNLGVGTKISFTNSETTLQKIRLSRLYYDIDVVGSSVGTNTLTTPILMQSGGTFTVKNLATFKHYNTAGFNGGEQTAIKNTNTPNISLEEGSTIEYLGENQVVTWVQPYYANLKILGSGLATLGDDMNIVVNQDLTIEGANLLIDTDQTLTVIDAIHNNSEIEIKHQGSLVQENEIDTNTGTGLYKIHKTTRPYTEYDYTYWASPVEGETINNVFNTHSSVVVPVGEPSNGDDFSFMNRIYWFDASEFNDDAPVDTFDDELDDWVFASGSTEMEKGVGYIAMGAGSDNPFTTDYASGLVQKVYFESNKVNNGTFTLALETDNSESDDFNNDNLIGNPYPSAIDLHLLRNDADNQIDGTPILGSTVRFWSHDTHIDASSGPWAYAFTNADYATYNIASGTGTVAHAGSLPPTQYWASCQSIFVEALSASDLHFKNSMRVKDHNDNFFNPTTEVSRLWLNLTNELGFFRQLAVVFLDEADESINDYDSKRKPLENETDFYSLVPDFNEKIEIQTLGSFLETMTIPLGLDVINAGVFSISLDHFEGVFQSGHPVFLEDKQHEVIHNLSESPYVFYTEAGSDMNERFVLRFTNALEVSNNAFDKELIVFPNPTKALIHVVYQTDEIAHLHIFDAAGKQVLTQYLTPNNSEVTLNIGDYPSGVYLLQFETTTQMTYRKLVLY